MNLFEARNILGVEQGAAEHEIKAAYRRLAKQYHPDMNPGENTSFKFQELKEAYQLLLNGGENAWWSAMDEAADVHDPQRAWREELRARRTREMQEQARYRQQLMRKIYRVLDYMVGIYMFFLGLLMLDYLLPATTHPEEVVAITQVRFSGQGTSRGVHSHHIIHFRNFELKLAREERWIPYGPATVYTTPILQTTMGAEVRQAGVAHRLEPVYGIYHKFGILILLAFGLGIFYYRLPLSGEKRLNVAIVILFIALFHIIMYLT